MTQIPSREALLERFAEIENLFCDQQSRFNIRETELNARLNDLATAVLRNPLQISHLPEEHPVRKVLGQSYQSISNQVKLWLANVERQESNLGFRARHDDSLLIFVYGKVKAGKSSLGNFLAYGQHRPDAEAIAHAVPAPHFFFEQGTGKGDGMTAEKMVTQRHFIVDLLEATAAIQGFTLPGMTWVDSPGIHSTTKENGALAKEYANSADLIVFVSNSSSPARESELAEINELLSCGKPVLILIAASDTVEEDEDAHGCVVSHRVMKKAEDRQAQVDYFYQALDKLPETARRHMLEVMVMPVSVCYAEEGTEEERGQRWQDSGMAEFAQRIAEIAARDGVRLKLEAPLRNLEAFCTHLARSSEVFQAILSEMGASLQSAQNDMEDEKRAVLNALRLGLDGELNMLVARYGSDHAGFVRACNDELNRRLVDAQRSLLQRAGQALEDAQTSCLMKLAQIDENLPGFKVITTRRSITSKMGEAVGRAGGGGILGAVGAGLGVAGGPLGIMAGAALGSMLGSWIGGKVGKNFNETSEVDIPVGDNQFEVVCAARDKIMAEAAQSLEHFQQSLVQDCFGELQLWLKQVASKLHPLQRVAALQNSAA